MPHKLSRMHWALTYGFSRTSLKLTAALGNPVAKLLIDTDSARDIGALVEQIRERGRMSMFADSAWVTTDVNIVRTVFRDNRFVTLKPQNHSRITSWLISTTDPKVLNPLAPPSILFSDPPEQTRLRRAVAAPFAPRALEALRHRITELVNEQLDTLSECSSCDLVADYTAKIPIAVIGEMLGAPADEYPLLYRLFDRAIRLITVNAPPYREYRSAVEALRELDDYLEMHIARLQRATSGSTVIGDLIEKGELDHFEIKLFAAVLLGAGFVTTTHLMGKGIVALLRHPEQLAALRSNPDGWANAIEEIIRYDTSNQWSARVATETVDIEGYRIEAGQSVLLLLGGANHDPAVFERPDIFDITRTNAREHITFGTGIHVCLGLTLARMELNTALRALFERFPSLALAEEPVFHDAMGIHGLRTLPVILNQHAHV